MPQACGATVEDSPTHSWPAKSKDPRGGARPGAGPEASGISKSKIIEEALQRYLHLGNPT